jgi:hypothetical protein
MASTTVVSDDTVTTVIDDTVPAVREGHRIAWSAIFSGALVATAVTFFLLALGSGFGLSLVSVRHATEEQTVTFVTLGAIYFFAAQAFGFAAGGHVTGRLMGPVLENPKEEEFLAGAHGLVTWALAVVATAGMIYLGALAAGATAAGGAMLGATAPNAGTMTPAENGYWVDRLFRPAAQAEHASLAWSKFAQAETGTANDASPVDSATQTPPPAGAVTDQQLGSPSTTATPVPPGRVEHVAPGPSSPVVNFPTSTLAPGDAVVPETQPRNVAADKAEAGRILTVAAAQGGELNEIDRAQLTHLVAMDTGQSEDSAMRRVESVEKQMHEAEVKTAETARKVAAYASLWTALALLFGSVIAVAAAISARWEDDRVTFSFLARE